MKPASRTTMWQKTAAMAFLGAVILGVAGCDVGVGAGYPAGYYGDYPPDGFIATTEPTYFEGHASYWYGGRWYYRDGGRWGHYDREPAALSGRRAQGPMVRRSYEPYRGRAVGRFNGGSPHRR